MDLRRVTYPCASRHTSDSTTLAAREGDPHIHTRLRKLVVVLITSVVAVSLHVAAPADGVTLGGVVASVGDLVQPETPSGETGGSTVNTDGDTSPDGGDASTVTPTGTDRNVVDFGANGADLLDDSAAIQAANDAAAAAGGGRVFFPAGTYLARGITHDSNVEFAGAGEALSTIKLYHPDTRTTAAGLIEGRRWTRTTMDTRGSIVEGSRQLIVNEPSKIVPGAMIAVRGAGEAASEQFTNLSLPMSSSATSIRVRDTGGGFATFSEHKFLKIGDEILSYTSSSPTMFLGLSRGRFGTPRSAHPIGAPVAQSKELIAEVVAVSGTTVTLDRPAFTGVKQAPITIGSVRMSIHDLTIDGDQRPDGAWSLTRTALSYGLARWVNVHDVTVQNADQYGLVFEIGTRDSRVEDSAFRNNGDEYAKADAHVMVFRNAIRNVVNNNVMSGPSKRGVFIDDRTASATGFDGPSVENHITNNVIDLWEDVSVGEAYPPSGVGVFGSWTAGGANNVISANTISFGSSDGAERWGTGVVLGYWSQGTSPRNSNLTTVTLNTFRSLVDGIRTSGVSNTFTDNLFSFVNEPCSEYGPARYNLFERNSVEPTGSCSP
jgi:hypothetical protein